MAGSKTNDFETSWAELSSSLKKIHTKDASALSFEEIYRKSYNIVLGMRGTELYERIQQLERDWLDTEVHKLVTGAISPSLLLAKQLVDAQDQANERRDAGERFLAVLKEAWEDHQLCMKMITDVLMYMVSVPSSFICTESALTEG